MNSQLSFPAFTPLTDLLLRDPGQRGVRELWNALPPRVRDFQAAVTHLAATRRAAIVTGFAIPCDDGLRSETDGPLGAAHLGSMLKAAGADVLFITDGPNLQVVRHAALAYRFQPEAVLEMPISPDPHVSESWVGEFLAGEGRGLTHLVAVERAGPAHGSHACHNMRGQSIEDRTARTHLLFEAASNSGGRITTIGIGDGGNEIGLGNVPLDVCRQHIPGNVGGAIACRIATDFTLLAGVSNWAAHGLALALGAQHGLATAWSPEFERELLHSLVHQAGACDGVTRQATPSVDGLPDEIYIGTLAEIRACLRA